MTADRLFEAYSNQVSLIVEWMAADRKSPIDEGKSKLKAACEQAVLDLNRELQELTELQGALTTQSDGPLMSHRCALQAETSGQRQHSKGGAPL